MNIAENTPPTKSAFMGAACVNCMASEATNQKLLQCSRCKRAKYCSKDCQKKDWKIHKVECQLHDIFLGYYNAAQNETHTSNLGCIVQKFQKTIDPMVANQMISPSVKKYLGRHSKFLLMAKVCHFCQKNEYDFLGNGNNNSRNAKWVNCSECHFGWCCSQEHFDEYKSTTHTNEVCEKFHASGDLDFFFWEHAKKEDDFFHYEPESTLSRVLDTFPSTWDEYFRIRCEEMYNLDRSGRLHPHFLPAATLELSPPLSCLHAMYVHGIEQFKDLDALVIHVVGAGSFERWPSCVWEEIMHCLPKLKRLTTIFVGPEATEGIEPPTTNVDSPDMECCPKCIRNKRSRGQHFNSKTYHDYKNTPTEFETPQLIVAFNTGLSEEDTESWKESLDVMVDLDVPCMFTEYDKQEADRSYAVFQSLGAKCLTLEPVLNPFRVDHPMVEYGGKDVFYQHSWFFTAFKGRR